MSGIEHKRVIFDGLFCSLFIVLPIPSHSGHSDPVFLINLNWK